MEDASGDPVKAANRAVGPKHHRPARFADPVADATAWTPVGTSATNVHTHRLVEETGDRLSIRPAWGAMAFSAFFFVSGLVCTIGVSAAYATDAGDLDRSAALLLIGLGVTFMGAGVWTFWDFRTPRVFDRGEGLYWRGREKPDVAEAEDCVELHRIHALQIVRVEARRSKESPAYTSYELNLVLEDASRVHVLFTGNGDALRNDADRLARFLQVPVWEA